MKKITAIIFSLVILLFVCGCSNNNSVMTNNLNIEKNTLESYDNKNGYINENNILESSDDKNSYTDDQTNEAYLDEYFISQTSDYISTDFNDIVKGADLVVRAKYIKNTDTYVSTGRLPITKAEFNIVEIIKGDYSFDAITVEYYGGTVSMYEYIQTMSEAEKLKGGYDYSEDEAKKIAVTYLDEENGVSFESDREYVICLGYNKDDGSYMIHSDAFGMSEVVDGKILNKAKGTTIDLNDICK